MHASVWCQEVSRNRQGKRKNKKWVITRKCDEVFHRNFMLNILLFPRSRRDKSRSTTYSKLTICNHFRQQVHDQTGQF
jgi:hypothetical protein